MTNLPIGDSDVAALTAAAEELQRYDGHVEMVQPPKRLFYSLKTESFSPLDFCLMIGVMFGTMFGTVIQSV